MTDPEGTVLGNATAGTAFSTGNEVLFSITAGATAFVAGDSFSLYLPRGTGDYLVSVKTRLRPDHRPEVQLQGDALAPKTWVEEDPAQRYLLMQSAPLLIPSRVNACFAATVCRAVLN